MRIQFCGADRTVTGSSHLLEINGLRILLDCGMYQGPRQEADRLNHWLVQDPKKIDVVILSHGHLDHCGKLPVLCRAGFSGPIHCTAATAAVARIVLEDAGKIQEEDAAYLNQRTRGPGERPIDPLYRRADIAGVIRQFNKVPYGQKTSLGKNISFTFFDAGHILGSAYVLLEWTEQGGKPQTLLFTADVGRYNTPILRDPTPIPGPVDQVITESTYGTENHGPMEAVEPQLLDAVQTVIKNRGRLIVPSFAVGRTQTILWYMQKFVAEGKIAPLPIYVDSPMGVEVSRVHSEFRDNYDDQTNKMIGEKDLFGLSNVTFASSPDQSRKINGDRGPCVIVASSPTCEFGRVLHHLTISLERSQDMIVFVGWIPPQTLGRKLQNGDKRVRVYDQWFDVRCQVRTIHGLSAHADGDELLRFLKPTLTRTTTFYVVHGEVDRAEGFAQRLLAGGAGCAIVPAMETAVVTGEGGGSLPKAGRGGEED